MPSVSRAIRYVQARTKGIKFAVPAALERDKCLYKDVVILKHQQYTDAPTQQSDIWCEMQDSDSPKQIHSFTERQFWDFVFSPKWKDYDVLRICDGELMEHLIETLFQLISTGRLITYIKVVFDNITTRNQNSYTRTPDESSRHVMRTHATKLPVKISFTYYGLPGRKLNETTAAIDDTDQRSLKTMPTDSEGSSDYVYNYITESDSDETSYGKTSAKPRVKKKTKTNKDRDVARSSKTSKGSDDKKHGEVMLPSAGFKSDVNADRVAELLTLKTKAPRYTKLQALVDQSAKEAVGLPLPVLQKCDSSNRPQRDRGDLINPSEIIYVNGRAQNDGDTIGNLLASGCSEPTKEYLKRRLHLKRPERCPPVPIVTKAPTIVSEEEWLPVPIFQSSSWQPSPQLSADVISIGSKAVVNGDVSHDPRPKKQKKTDEDDDDDDDAPNLIRMPRLNKKYSSERMARMSRVQYIRNELSERSSGSDISVMCRRLESFASEKYQPYLNQQSSDVEIEPIRLYPIAFSDKQVCLPRKLQPIVGQPVLTNQTVVHQPSVDRYELVMRLVSRFTVYKEHVTGIGRYWNTIKCLTISKSPKSHKFTFC